LLGKKEEDMETGGAITDYVNDNPVIEVDDNGVPVCPPAVYYCYDNYYYQILLFFLI